MSASFARSGNAGLDGAPIAAPWLNDDAGAGGSLRGRPFGRAKRRPPRSTSLTPCANTAVTTLGNRRLFVEAWNDGRDDDRTARDVGRAASLSCSRLCSQAPAQPAIGAGRRRLLGQQRRAEFPIGRPVPDFPQGLLGCIAQRVVFVAMLRKRRDAARQCAAIGGEIHQRPGPPAERPGRALVGFLQAQARLRRRTRRAEGDAERARQVLGLFESSPLPRASCARTSA